MKVVIAGSRELTIERHYGMLLQCIDKIKIGNPKFFISEIVSGTCRGGDRIGEHYAKEHDIPIKYFPANWGRFGKQAGFIRNKQMADYGNFLIALWYNNSAGTENMIRLMKQNNKHGWIKVITRL